MFLHLLESHDRIKVLDHKCMVPGHSNMECDFDHARIENTRKTYSASIDYPHKWVQLIQYAGKDKFKVIEMKQNE